MNRSDTAVVGVLVLLLALVAGLIGIPAIQSASTPVASPDPAAVPPDQAGGRPYVEGMLGAASSVSPLTARTHPASQRKRRISAFSTNVIRSPKSISPLRPKTLGGSQR